ncbi:hypothetical protein BJ508DRAFT_307864 [Ascobolus immersus RN42]|uniref:Cyanovirin-N domain-containing protein n=1 Tax=Ascobolus immersus RN42 TaxID=1160509 RepID=A0A3N4I1U4_ASCIM|nr:hypothetical protein BJ508DRAFT_307864 [Ascobolus immersus RN42]
MKLSISVAAIATTAVLLADSVSATIVDTCRMASGQKGEHIIFECLTYNRDWRWTKLWVSDCIGYDTTNERLVPKRSGFFYQRCKGVTYSDFWVKAHCQEKNGEWKYKEHHMGWMWNTNGYVFCFGHQLGYTGNVQSQPI